MGERKATLGLAPILPGLVLVVVIVWALVAVLLLTGTLVNAREIDKTIPLINNQVSPIDKDLDNVKLAAKTARISGRIRKSAAPLTDQADRIIVRARSIDANVVKILATATAINETAGSINGTVRAINGKVTGINGDVVSINDTVDSIQGNALAINRTVDTIGSRVTTINARVGSIFNGVGPIGARDDSIKAGVGRIFGTFTSLSPEVRRIDTGVAAINKRAIRAIPAVASLRTDLVPISVLVGPGALGPAGHGTEGPGAIHGHANSIDCSALINSLGGTEYCGR